MVQPLTRTLRSLFPSHGVCTDADEPRVSCRLVGVGNNTEPDLTFGVSELFARPKASDIELTNSARKSTKQQ